jgi:hypothetical protein
MAFKMKGFSPIKQPIEEVLGISSSEQHYTAGQWGPTGSNLGRAYWKQMAHEYPNTLGVGNPTRNAYTGLYSWSDGGQWDKGEYKTRSRYKERFYNQFPEFGNYMQGTLASDEVPYNLPLIERWLRDGDPNKSKKFNKVVKNYVMENPEMAEKLGITGDETQPTWNKYHWDKYNKWKRYKEEEEKMWAYESQFKWGDFQHTKPRHHKQFGLSEEELQLEKETIENNIKRIDTTLQKNKTMHQLILESQELYK